MKEEVLKNAEIWRCFADIRSKTRAKFFQSVEIKAPNRDFMEFDFIKITFAQPSSNQSGDMRVLFESNIDDETAKIFNQYFTTERKQKIRDYVLANKKFYQNLYRQLYQRSASDEYIDVLMNERINMLYLLLQNYFTHIDASLFLQWLKMLKNEDVQKLPLADEIFREMATFPTNINNLKEVIRVNIETENVLYSLIDKLNKSAQQFLSSHSTNEKYDPEFIPKVIQLDFV